MSLGEIRNPITNLTFELQLKGCGRSPFSRGFDGRAVLRSSIREFLVSEAMHHMNVPTTRALSVIATGETVTRPWYATTSEDARTGPEGPLIKYPPNMMKKEPGAVVCRVAPSFLRFAHLELFAIRGEFKELLQLADFVCLREFPSLLIMPLPERYIELYRQVVRANAALVVDWLRVGYVQGNMNSDNTCLAGRTIDYGPFGWMEAYEPKYQPFTSDRDGKFAFILQPSAMQININVLGEKAFVDLVREAFKLVEPNASEDDVNVQIQALYNIANEEFPSTFWKSYDEMKRRKLGLVSFKTSDGEDAELWKTLEELLIISKADYTMFFRELAIVADSVSPEDALYGIEVSFNSIGGQSDVEFRRKWCAWLERYAARIKREGPLWSHPSQRIESQNQSNPKYVPRNWMLVLAYENAEKGDFSLVRELQDLFSDPYAQNETEEQAKARLKWYMKTPTWARNMPGVTFMSCSS